MATTTPIPESILADVATKLALITTGNSFRNTVATVGRQFLNPQTIGRGSKMPMLAVFDEKIDWEVHGIGSAPKQMGVFLFKIQGLMVAYSNPSTTISKLVQDVREKLYEDRSRGGYADNTHVLSVELGGEGLTNKPFAAKPFVGFLMEVEVNYQEHL